MRISQDEACSRLLDGGVVAIPTETVYGLAASLSNTEAIKCIFTLKQRPADNPLIIHLAHVADLEKFLVDSSPDLDKLTGAFWPGPLTLVLPVNQARVPDLARAHLATAAFRIPNHPIARAIATRVGPLVAPSANLSGRPSATTAAHVEEDFGAAFPVVDGGATGGGVESTILVYVDSHWQIARLGFLPSEVFEKVLGYQPPVFKSMHQKNAAAICPGQYYRHYAPRCILKLSHQLYDGHPQVVVGYEDRDYPHAREILMLGPSTDPVQVSHNLYQVLRLLDQKEIPEAWVDLNIPQHGLWQTIRERLTRASSPH